MSDAANPSLVTMICYFSQEQQRFLVVEGSPFEPLLDWDDYDDATPIDADVVVVCVTESADELLRLTSYASSLAEEDVVGLSAVPESGFSPTRNNHLMGLDEINEVYGHRR